MLITNATEKIKLKPQFKTRKQLVNVHQFVEIWCVKSLCVTTVR